MKQISDRKIARLCLYRRMLRRLRAEGAEHVYSHELNRVSRVGAVQVRKDLMLVGYSGSASRGYSVQELAVSLGAFLDGEGPDRVALVGVGNLGKAILAYFLGRRSNLTIAAAFDSDPLSVGRVIHGCKCYSINELPQRVAELGITVGIVAVPAGEAQAVADMLAAAGVGGLLNFAPAALRVPPNVYVEDVDISTSLEKVAFFARQRTVPAEHKE